MADLVAGIKKTSGLGTNDLARSLVEFRGGTFWANKKALQRWSKRGAPSQKTLPTRESIAEVIAWARRHRWLPPKGTIPAEISKPAADLVAWSDWEARKE